MTRTGKGGTSSLFLILGVCTSITIGSVGYASGSTPEWIVLKASIGLIAVGLVGWVASIVIGSSPDKLTQKTGDNTDTTGGDANAAPAEASRMGEGANDAANPGSSER